MVDALPFAILYFLGAAIGTATAVRVSRDRSIAARELLGLTIAAAQWCLSYGFEVLARTASYRILWSQVAYLGTYVAAVFLLRFAIRWTRPRAQGWWIQLFWIVPVLMIIGVFTNGVHGLVWSSVRPSEDAAYIWIYSRGPLFWVGITYQYLVIAVSVVILGAFAYTSRAVYRRQTFYVLGGVLSAILFNGLYLFHVFSVSIDISPLGLALGTVIVFSGIRRARLLDLLPEARHRVVDLMPDALLVLDADLRVIDWNRAAAAMWSEHSSVPTGILIRDLVPQWTESADRELAAAGSEVFRTALTMGGNRGMEKHLDVEAHRFHLGANKSAGWTVLFRDESEVRRAERELQEANDRLEALNKMLLSQAIHDSLTGLFNRAYLDEALPRELARCERDESSIALLILDIDHFKEINDSHGHDTGDRVLREVGSLVRGIVRAGDIPCRFGGDEIVAVMPGASEREAMTIAERIRTRVSEELFDEKDTRLDVTVSVGVAVYPDHADSSADLFRAADRALYSAKDAGRNRAFTAAAAG